MNQHLQVNWEDGEIVGDPNEEIDFDSGLPSTVSKSKQLRINSPPVPLGEGKYRGTDLDFDEGLPIVTTRVTISKAAVEEIISPVETRVSTRTTQSKPSSSPSHIKAEKSGFPSVLTWESVQSGTIPETGTSGLPTSLEQDVPPAFRFWKCDNPTEARAVRDALVETQIFAPETVRLVNGEMRRAVVETVEKLFLAPVYDDSEPVTVPVYVRPVEKVAGFLDPSESEQETVLFDEDITSILGIEVILEKASSLAADFVIAARDTKEIRKAIGGPAFQLKSRSDLVFTTNVPLVCEDLIEWVQLERSDEVLKFALSEGRTIPILKSAEERIVYGIVLEPEELDSQKDIISKEEIEQACHKFMEKFGGLGRQHKELVNGKLVLLENFIAPVNFEVGGQMVKSGSWLMKERVVDDHLWIAVKNGEYTGYSIGGTGVRKPA